MSISVPVNGQSVIYPNNGTLLNNKKEQTIDIRESQKLLREVTHKRVYIT